MDSRSRIAAVAAAVMVGVHPLPLRLCVADRVRVRVRVRSREQANVTESEEPTVLSHGAHGLDKPHARTTLTCNDKHKLSPDPRISVAVLAEQRRCRGEHKVTRHGLLVHPTHESPNVVRPQQLARQLPVQRAVP